MPFALGPSLNIRLMPRISLETGVTFYRLGRQENTSSFLYPENSLTLLSSFTRGRALEIPILGKFYFRGESKGWRPFITAGVAVRRSSLTSSFATSVISGNPLGPAAGASQVTRKTVFWDADPSAGAGIDFKAGRIHFEPQVRYSYWDAGNNSLIRKNQAFFLLGIRF